MGRNKRRSADPHADLKARLTSLLIKALSKHPYEPDPGTRPLETPYGVEQAANDILTKRPELVEQLLAIDDVIVVGLSFFPAGYSPSETKMLLAVQTVLTLVEDSDEVATIETRRQALFNSLRADPLPAPPAPAPMRPASPGGTSF